MTAEYNSVYGHLEAEQVTLCLQSLTPEISLQMVAEVDGWYGITTDLARSGFHYQYLINSKQYVPDPASRYQPQDVNGSSQIIDPNLWQWQDQSWKGRPWEEIVFYELHIGTFTEEGTFVGVKNRLDYLVDLGVTAIQLMPVADFPGQRNWGYDGVLPFSPDSSYGSPDTLKDLIATAHAKGLMVFNDVVYNHFGPEGNYLHLYAPSFFTDRYSTPWGEALNFSAKNSYWVRQFFIHNALYWLEEYHFDGLRFDAVHSIFDDSTPDFLEELAEAIRRWPGFDRTIYLVLENGNNAAHYLRHDSFRPYRYFDAQWNDDIHHALHVLLTGESAGYYQDFVQKPLQHLGRCLTEGFAYQGEISDYFNRKTRGEPCTDLTLTAFISFLQNHDQVGNRALGERISTLCSPEALRAATAILLLSPSPPLLFMGQEWASSQPFTYFVDFSEELGDKVNHGRLQEFAQFNHFNHAELCRKIPLPNAVATFQLAKLVWNEINHAPHQQWFEFHRELLHIRSRYISPKLKIMVDEQAYYWLLNEQTLKVEWRFNKDSTLIMIANLSCKSTLVDCLLIGEVLFASNLKLKKNRLFSALSPWSVIYCLDEQ